MTDREDLSERTAEAFDTAVDRALSSPEGRAAYEGLRATGATLTV